MSSSIIKYLCREISRAFIAGNFKVKAYNKEFILEHVYAKQWRLVSEDGNDVGLRWNVESGKLHFFMA